MRKTAAIFAVFAMIISLAFCGASDGSAQASPTPAPTEVPAETAEPAPEIADEPAETEPTEVPEAPDAADGPENGSNILIAYFSRVGNMNYEEGVDATTSASVNLGGGLAGNAELLAQMAQEATGGDMFFIETVDKYPAQYRATTDQAKVEQNDNTRPELASHVDNMDAYDTVILIYPNWWGDLPQAVFTFLEEYDFAGKTILPLCTHEGSGLGRTPGTISSLCPDATLLNGLAVRGGNAASAQSDVENWITSSGILS